MQRRLFVLASLLFASTQAMAIPDNRSTPIVGEPYHDNFKMTGYIDGSYNYLLRSNQFYSHEFDRLYDLQENGFTLQQAEFMINREPHTGWGGLFEGIVGRDAYEIAPQGFNADVFGMKHIGFAFPQAYISYTQAKDIIKVGEVLSLAGLEAHNYTLDANFSRSILDEDAQSGPHVGIRNIYNMNEQVSFIAGLANGWATIEHIYTQNKVELGLNVTEANYSFMIDTYSGYEYLDKDFNSGTTSWRNFIDMFGTYNVTEKLSIAANYDYAYQNQGYTSTGTVERISWQGIAGYLNYLFNDKWRTSLRGEFFTDPQGFITGVKQNWEEVTVSLAYNPFKHLQLRAETRHDFSNVNAFLNKTGFGRSNNQQSYAFDVLYQF